MVPSDAPSLKLGLHTSSAELLTCDDEDEGDEVLADVLTGGGKGGRPFSLLSLFVNRSDLNSANSVLRSAAFRGGLLRSTRISATVAL